MKCGAISFVVSCLVGVLLYETIGKDDVYNTEHTEYYIRDRIAEK